MNFNNMFKTNKDLGLLILRVGVSLCMLTHGYGKLQRLINDPTDFGDPIGLGATISLLLVVLGEFIAPLFVIVGYKTKIATLFPLITMLVAAFVVHASDPFGKKEMAVLYAICFLVIAISGAGKISLDKH
ncbi:DoxX family protein [Flavobacteriaceae bacterium]|nr:DoxX family protein [Flavobacteriaceae bacterium]